MVVLVLLSGVSFALMLNARSSGDRIKSQGLTRALTEELRAARAFATQEQTDVVLVFPSSIGGGACRSVRIYQGEDSLQPLRSLGFDTEHDSFIFVGSWPAASVWNLSPTLPAAHGLPPDKNVLMFRPDGSVLSNLPRLNGTYCLVVANALKFDAGEGTMGQLTAVKNPNTILIQPTGSIKSVNGLHMAPVPLPSTEEKPVLLTLDKEILPTPQNPVIEKISFFPQSGSLEGSTGMGKTFIEIHSAAASGKLKEYGMATVEVEATDPDGGPLYLDIEVEPSEGAAGTLASVGSVRMEYLNNRWKGSVGWRPPADAEPEVSYHFKITVTDRTGRTTIAKSDASVLPVLRTLADNRLAIESTDGGIYLANLEGAELVRITPKGTSERQPLWSGDGTKLYVLAESSSGPSLVRYNADGTERVVITSFPKDATGFQVDASGMYIGYIHSTTVSMYTTWDGKGPPQKSDVSTQSLSVLHVSNGSNSRVVASDVTAGFRFLPYQHGLFQYQRLTVGDIEGPVYGDDGVEVEGELTNYSELGNDYEIAVLTGLAPDFSKVGVDKSVNATKGTFNPYEPSFFVGPGNSVRSKSGGKGKDAEKLYLFHNGAEGWADLAELGPGKDLIGTPIWSANGDWLVYSMDEGGTQKLKVQQVTLPLEGKLLKVEKPRVLNLTAPVHQVQPTPSGDAVLFIEGAPGSAGSRLMSLATNGESKPVRIGVGLPGVASYAVTQ